MSRIQYKHFENNFLILDITIHDIKLIYYTFYM